MMKIFGEGKLFGREPTLWVAAATAVINFLVGFQLDFLSPEQGAWIATVVNAAGAIFVAFQARPVAPNVFSYGISSVAGLLGAYGLDMSQEMVTSTQGLVLMLFVLVSRGQVSPIEDASTTGVMGDKVTTEDVPEEVVEEIQEEIPALDTAPPAKISWPRKDN